MIRAEPIVLEVQTLRWKMNVGTPADICSSSEVAAMIEGILRHCTSAEIEKNYVDTHGQSEVAFAFCHLLGFRLLPRLKNISPRQGRGSQKQ